MCTGSPNNTDQTAALAAPSSVAQLQYQNYRQQQQQQRQREQQVIVLEAQQHADDGASAVTFLGSDYTISVPSVEWTTRDDCDHREGLLYCRRVFDQDYGDDSQSESSEEDEEAQDEENDDDSINNNDSSTAAADDKEESEEAFTGLEERIIDTMDDSHTQMDDLNRRLEYRTYLVTVRFQTDYFVGGECLLDPSSTQYHSIITEMKHVLRLEQKRDGLAEIIAALEQLLTSLVMDQQQQKRQSKSVYERSLDRILERADQIEDDCELDQHFSYHNNCSNNNKQQDSEIYEEARTRLEALCLLC